MRYSKNIDTTIKILKKREVFCGTLHDAERIENEYCLFVVGSEKFRMMTYLRELFYGEQATTGRI